MFRGIFYCQNFHIKGVKRGKNKVDGYKWVTSGLQVGYTKEIGNLLTSFTNSGIVFSVYTL